MRTIGKKKSDGGGSSGTRFFGGSLGIGILAVVLFLIGAPWWFVIPLSVAGFVGGIFLLAPKKKTLSVSVEGMTPEMVAGSIAEGRKKIEAIAESARKIFSGEIRRKIDEVRKQASLILDEIEKDPRDIKTARQFLTYYLDATLKIINQYGELSGKNRAGSPEMDALLAKAEGMLDTIAKAFEKQRALLLENDAMKLETEITVLDKTIKMHGLGDEAKQGGQ